MPITEEAIADLYRHRQNRDRERRDKQDEVSRVYNDRLIVDLPELDMAASSAAANLTETGIDQWGMRIASADPELDYALDGHIGSKESRDRQLNRKHAMTALFTQNTLKTRIRRPRARQLVAFAQAPVRIGWGDLGLKYGEGPKWMLKDPREVFPNPTIDIHDPLPDNVIYGRTVPASEAKKKWPDAVSNLNLRSVTGGDPILEIVTYDDAEELVVVIMASGRELSAHSPTGVAMVDSGFAPRAAVQELHREPNRIGICPWTVPGRIGLDELKGQFDGSSALYRTMAKLTALSLIATEKGVFQEEWLVGTEGRTPRVMNVADSRTGEIGVVTGGTLHNRTVDPQFQTAMMLDRLERSERARGGVTADMTGEAATNVRTGRRGAQLMSAQVDEGVQEAQEVLAVALQYEVEMAQEVDRAYSGPKTVLVGWKGSRKPLTYDPKQLWDGAQPMVGYSFPGVSTDGMEIKAGQRIAMQTMSRQRFMEVDPYIEDPELEKDRIVTEALNDAMLQSIATLAAAPEGPYQPAQIARIAHLVLSDRMELAAAITKVQEETQEAQATPVEPGAPEAQPGLSPPGQGVEQPAAIQGPNTLQQNLGNVMARLRQPEMTVASER